MQHKKSIKSKWAHEDPYRQNFVFLIENLNEIVPKIAMATNDNQYPPITTNGTLDDQRHSKCCYKVTELHRSHPGLVQFEKAPAESNKDWADLVRIKDEFEENRRSRSRSLHRARHHQAGLCGSRSGSLLGQQTIHLFIYLLHFYCAVSNMHKISFDGAHTWITQCISPNPMHQSNGLLVHGTPYQHRRPYLFLPSSPP